MKFAVIYLSVFNAILFYVKMAMEITFAHNYEWKFYSAIKYYVNEHTLK